MTPELRQATERHARLDQAQMLGIDFEVGRGDWDALEHAVDAVLPLPADRRVAAAARTSDGVAP